MSVITPPTVDPLPPAPSTASPSTFDALADAFIAALISFGTQLSALAANVFGNATDAATSATAAAAASVAASSAAGVAIWVSGTTYAVGDTRFSPTTFYSYRRRTAGAGTTDPTSDPTNWQLISTVNPPGYLNVREIQPAGTGGATVAAVGYTNRALNTLVVNSIAGASFSAGSVILPPGTFQVRARASYAANNGAGSNVLGHKVSLYNQTDSVFTIVGGSNFCTGNSATDSLVVGQFSITATKTFCLRHYTNSGALGNAVGAQVEVYSEIEIFKVA